ncbi:MAG: SWF/SNF helicase family protein [Bacteroidetes bacterium]|nr:SWF/SNF helicase family protein [Bacteroidota bacterium]
MLKEKLTEILESNHNVLIFSQFVKHLELIESYLQKRAITYSKLTGNTQNREAAVSAFNDNSKCNVFLISLKAGGVGLNLTKADYVFVIDPWWNPFVEKQAIDRAYRIGQEKHVFAYHFITKNTIEEKIQNLQRKKKNLSAELLTGQNSVLAQLKKDDLQELFS